MKIRTYEELISIKDFGERLNYLKLDGIVGIDTFGFDRVFNQMFYKSYDWKRIRNKVILRDKGCDLAANGHEILNTKILIHHMNPITVKDIWNKTDLLLNPDFLITTILPTHNIIHYGTEYEDISDVERRPNDTCPWRK